jgi:hypothetical protein
VGPFELTPRSAALPLRSAERLGLSVFAITLARLRLALEFLHFSQRSPRMRAARIKPRVKRASFASGTLGYREGGRKPTEWALDAARESFNAWLRSPASRVPFISITIPRVPLRPSLRFGAPLHPGLYSSRPHSRARLNCWEKRSLSAQRSGEAAKLSTCRATQGTRS